jgi:hypothetical protein
MQGLSNGGHWFDFRSANSNLWSMGAQPGLMGWFNRTDSTYKMVITDSGNVGIGTTSPSAKFTTIGNATQNVGLSLFQNDHSTGGEHYPAASFVNTRGNHSYGIVADFRISTSGDLDRPSILFYGAQASHSWQVGQVTNGWGTNDAFGIGYRASNTPGSFSSWPTNYFTILTNGNVGIGTTTPTARLNVRGTTYLNGDSTNDTWSNASPTLAIKRGNNLPFISLHDNAGNRQGYVQFANTFARIRSEINGPFYIGTNSADHITILGNGHVGIGTTSPSHLLHIDRTPRIDSVGNQPGDISTWVFGEDTELVYGDRTQLLGEPALWLKININGSDYNIPAYQ